MRPALVRRRARDRVDRHADRDDLARVWQLAVGRNTLLLLDSNVEGNQPEDRELTSRLYGGDERVRIRQELLLGVGGVRALGAMGIAPGVLHLNEGHSAFAALELVRQRMADRRHRRVGGAAPRVAAGRLHDAHAGARRPRSLLRTARRRASRPALRDARAPAPRADGPRPRAPARRRRGVLHDGARAQGVATAPTPSRRSTARSRARCGPASFPARPTSACRSATSPTASTSRRGSRRRCARSTTAISAPTGRSTRATPASGTAIDAIDDGELWETHQTLKVQLIETRAAAGRAPGRAPRRVAGVRRADAPRAEPRRADDRLRPPLRHLQARQPAAAGHRGASPRSSTTRRCPSSSSSPASRIRTTGRARRCCSRSRGSCTTRASPARCCSSRTTTSTSAGTSCRASTCGSTTRGGRSRRAARAGRRSC